eukprot:6628904-Karenia_brevis.AAC.1
MKQATGHDTPGQGEKLFQGVRPNITVDEGEEQNTFSQETIAESAMSKVAGVDINVSNICQDQLISHYGSRVFPWAVNYDCGGADFTDWQRLERQLGEEAVAGLKERWRRK